MTEMEATRKSRFSWLVSGLLQFPWMLLRLQKWRPCCSVSSNQLLLHRFVFLAPLVEFVIRKGSIDMLSFVNCALKAKKSGNWIWTVTGACCKSPVVRATEIPEGQTSLCSASGLSLIL